MKLQIKRLLVIIIGVFLILLGVAILLINKNKCVSNSSVRDIKILTTEDLNDPYYYTIDIQ